MRLAARQHGQRSDVILVRMGDNNGIHRALCNCSEMGGGTETIDFWIRARIKNDIFAPDTQPVTI